MWSREGLGLSNTFSLPNLTLHNTTHYSYTPYFFYFQHIVGAWGMGSRKTPQSYIHKTEAAGSGPLQTTLRLDSAVETRVNIERPGTNHTRIHGIQQLLSLSFSSFFIGDSICIADGLVDDMSVVYLAATQRCVSPPAAILRSSGRIGTHPLYGFLDCFS